jgi:hypothetical protein
VFDDNRERSSLGRGSPVSGAAPVLGFFTRETIYKLIQQAKPSLEKDLLAKADAAIVKAVDSKEFRIGLGKLRTQKPETPDAKSEMAK